MLQVDDRRPAVALQRLGQLAEPVLVVLLDVVDPQVDHIKELEDVSEFDLLEIQHFFEVYKDLEPGKSVEGATWAGREEAEAEIEASRRRAIESNF